MLEREVSGKFSIRRYPTEVFPKCPERLSSAETVSSSTALPTIQLLASGQLKTLFDSTLERMQRLADTLPKSSPSEKMTGHAPPYTPLRPQRLELLPSALEYLDRLQKPPLLPAPPSFEAVFARFEPMFHTVFYRKYPDYLREDAKQEALLHLWKQWKRDMSVLDQSAAFVTQAALWGAGNARKKRRKVEQRELPMLPHERYIDIRVSDGSRDPGWMQRIDRLVDVQEAIKRVRRVLQKEDYGENLLMVLQDVVCHRSRTAARRTSPLGWRAYGRYREQVEGLLREALAEYASTNYQ